MSCALNDSFTASVTDVQTVATCRTLTSHTEFTIFSYDSHSAKDGCILNHQKVDHQLMAITLSKPNLLSKILPPLKRGLTCKQSAYNIVHHTQSMLSHYMWKFKV